jgi:hypothetical protein
VLLSSIILCLQHLPLAAPSSAEGPPLPPTGLSSKAPKPARIFRSRDGRFLWVEGESSIIRYLGPGGTRPLRLRLPAGPEEGGLRHVLFADLGSFFCVADEYQNEVGLHPRTTRGSRGAHATLVHTVLRLVDLDGHVVWTRETQERAVVGGPAGLQTLHVSRNGTLAILLQDTGGPAAARPVLLVVDRHGRERLRLDDVSWKRIDGFSLSEDARTLVVRGYGLIPDAETWGKAAGFYDLAANTSRIQPTPRETEKTPLRAAPTR